MQSQVTIETRTRVLNQEVEASMFLGYMISG